jgi:hypothetical protein
MAGAAFPSCASPLPDRVTGRSIPATFRAFPILKESRGVRRSGQRSRNERTRLWRPWMSQQGRPSSARGAGHHAFAPEPSATFALTFDHIFSIKRHVRELVTKLVAVIHYWLSFG